MAAKIDILHVRLDAEDKHYFSLLNLAWGEHSKSGIVRKALSFAAHAVEEKQAQKTRHQLLKESKCKSSFEGDVDLSVTYKKELIAQMSTSPRELSPYHSLGS